jgi:hypothetical protein
MYVTQIEVFEKRVPRKITVSIRAEVVGEKKLHPWDFIICTIQHALLT